MASIRAPGGGTLASLLTTAITAETAGSQIAAALTDEQAEELTTQLRGEGIALPWDVAVDLDFTALATADWSADTSGTPAAKTVGGYDATSTRHASASAWGITAAGLTQVGSGAGGSSLDVALTELIPGYDAETDRLIVVVTGTAASLAAGHTEQVLLRSETGPDVIGVQLRDTGSSSHGYRGTTTQDGSQVSGSHYATQAGAPTSWRVQLDYWRGAGVISGDLDAGHTLPATPTTLAALADLSLYAQGAPAAGAIDPAAAFLRLQLSPGSGGTASVRRLLIWRLRSTV